LALYESLLREAAPDDMMAADVRGELEATNQTLEKANEEVED
jgi:hypothetical protein